MLGGSRLSSTGGETLLLDAVGPAQRVLPCAWINGILEASEFRAPLASPFAGMTRILLRSHRLLAVSVLLLLGVVVWLSTATRRPCLLVRSGPWRLWKAGHMTKPEGQEVRNRRLTAEAKTPAVASEHGPPPFPPISIQLDETIPPATPIEVRVRHLRAPPCIG